LSGKTAVAAFFNLVVKFLPLHRSYPSTNFYKNVAS
jgi:hypothetical protein